MNDRQIQIAIGRDLLRTGRCHIVM